MPVKTDFQTPTEFAYAFVALRCKCPVKQPFCEGVVLYHPKVTRNPYEGIYLLPVEEAVYLNLPFEIYL